VPVSAGTRPGLRHNDAQRPPIPFSHQAFLKSMVALIRAFSEHATQPLPPLLRLTTLVATARTLFLGGGVYRRRFVHKGRIRR